jgi:serine/threonine protein kinase
MMTRALQSLHSLGIVHGDVKLANMCCKVDQDGSVSSVKLIDYGAAVSRMNASSLGVFGIQKKKIMANRCGIQDFFEHYFTFTSGHVISGFLERACTAVDQVRDCMSLQAV